MYHICIQKRGQPVEYLESRLNAYAAERAFRELLLNPEYLDLEAEAILYKDDEELCRHRYGSSAGSRHHIGPFDPLPLHS